MTTEAEAPKANATPVESKADPGVDEVQWRRPVRAGDKVRLDGEVLDKRGSSRPERGFVRFRFSMWRPKETGEDERVMMFTCSVMFRRRASAGSA